MRPLLLAVPLLACSPTPPESRAEPTAILAPLRIAAASEGGLAFVDLTSGAVLAHRESGPLEDLVVDPFRKQVLAFETIPREEGGYVVHHPLDPTAPARRWFVDGAARLAAVPAGTLVFERSYGERWRLVGDRPTSSLPLPLPRSPFVEGTRVLGLTEDGVLRTAETFPFAVTDERPLLLTHRTARVARTASGLCALDLENGVLVLRTLEATATPLAIRAGAIVDLTPYEGGLAALVDQPLQLVIVRGTVAHALPLPGHPCGEEHPGCHALVAAPPRVAIGTRERVHVVRMSADLRLDLENTLEGVHGPIAGPLP